MLELISIKRGDYMKRCDYCGKEISYYDQYCCDDCHENANIFYDKLESHSKLFSRLSIVLLFGIPIGIFLFSFIKVLGTAITCICFLVLGLMLIFCPLPTEGMLKKYKIKKSLSITKYFGIAVILLGILFLLFAIFF